MVRWLLLLGGLLGGRAAWAHRPHNVVVALAVDEDFGRSGEAWLVQDPHDISSLMHSVDFGAHWDFVGSPACEDELVDAAFSDGVLLLLGEDGTLWQSEDGAQSWSSAELPVGRANDLDAVGAQLAVATGDGVWLGAFAEPGALVQGLAGLSVPSVALDPTDSQFGVALDSDDAVWETLDGGLSWTQRTATLPGGRTGYTAATVAGSLYVGSTDGVLRLDLGTSTWTLCGALPATSTAAFANDVPLVTTLASGRLLASTGEQALFFSDDACESWTLLDAGVEVEYGGIGDAYSARQAFTGLALADEHALSGGFMGVSTSEDGASRWTAAKLLPEDYSKGVALSPNFAQHPVILRAGYGGGVAWSEDGGQSWCGSAVGVDGAYSNDVAASSDFPDSGLLYYVGSNSPYRSVDSGETWRELEVPMDRARRFEPLADRLWVLGEDQIDGQVRGRLALSTDDGDSWDLLDAYATASDEAAPRDLSEAVLDGVVVVLVVTDTPAGLLASVDRGLSWIWLYQGGEGTAAGGGVWPPDAGTRLVFASAETGVLLSDDGGGAWRSPTTPPVGSPRDLAQGDDGTWLLVTREGQFYRSEDGAETWTAAGEPLGRAEFAMALSDQFAVTSTAVVGTDDGLFWSQDRGDSWHRLPRYERFEADTYHLLCTPADGAESCEAWADPTAGLGGGWDLAVGDRVSFVFHGQGFRVLGKGDGVLSVSVNGEDQGEIQVGDAVSLVGEEWKDVVLTLSEAGAEGLQLDVVEASTDGEPMPVDLYAGLDTAGSEEDCGYGYRRLQGGCTCSGAGPEGSGGMVGIVLLLAVGRRRRGASWPQKVR